MTLFRSSEKPRNMVGAYGNATDRALGVFWENQFIQICKEFGWEAWPFAQIKGPAFIDQNTGIKYISPDVWVLRRGNKQYACEVKHKAPTRHMCYGLEKYRADSLAKLSDQYVNQFGPVESLYVIHNHALSGGRDAKINEISHWQAQKIKTLQSNIKLTATGKTYRNGIVTNEPIHYYNLALFQPLINFVRLSN